MQINIRFIVNNAATFIIFKITEKKPTNEAFFLGIPQFNAYLSRNLT